MRLVVDARRLQMDVGDHGPQRLAQRAGFDDAVFVDAGGAFSEGPTWNLGFIDRAGSLDSTSIMELDQVPEHLIVLGGGYIGLEFAQMFRRFGSRVTVIQRGRQLLPLEDEDIAEAVLGVLREDGIDVLLEAGMRHVVVADKDGVVHAGREGLAAELVSVADRTNADNRSGALRDVLPGLPARKALPGAQDDSRRRALAWLASDLAVRA